MPKGEGDANPAEPNGVLDEFGFPKGDAVPKVLVDAGGFPKGEGEAGASVFVAPNGAGVVVFMELAPDEKGEGPGAVLLPKVGFGRAGALPKAGIGAVGAGAGALGAIFAPD